MAKNRTATKEYHVYQQTDGALVVFLATADPFNEDEEEIVWSGEAENERDAIMQARASSRSLRTAPAADLAYEPELTNTVRERVQAEVNERLGITGAKKSRGSKKRASSRAGKTRATTSAKGRTSASARKKR